MDNLLSDKEKIHLKYALPFSFIAFVVITLTGLIPFPETASIGLLFGTFLLPGLLNMIIYVGILFLCIKKANSSDAEFEKYSLSLYYLAMFFIFNTILLSIIEKGFKLYNPGLIMIFVTFAVPLFVKGGSSKVTIG